jgi:hypothetical protein
VSAAKADRPVKGRVCAHCGKFPRFRKNVREHKYCSKTCATDAGVYPRKVPDSKHTTHVGMLGYDGTEDV